MSTLTVLDLEFSPNKPREIASDWAHVGIVSSGDLEVLLEKHPLGNVAKYHVVTKVKGFNEVWEAVLRKFTEQSGASNVIFSINDNAATPAVVIKRLQQVLKEAGWKEGEV